MPCAPTHRLINFAATAGFLASRPQMEQRGIAHPLAGGGASAVLATLPDLVEPALSPNHRQFFHSIVFAGMVGYGIYRAYQWKPDVPAQQFLRYAILLVGSAYLLHLAADMCTSKSLPILGKL